MALMEFPNPEDSPKGGLLTTILQYKIPIALGAFSILLITLSLVLFFQLMRSSEPIQFHHENEAGISTQSSETANLSYIKIDVEGAVQHPGITSVLQGSRVEDAIAAAGGLKPEADKNYVAKTMNRAMKLGDGMKVYIPTVDETSHIGDCTTSRGDVAQSCTVVATSGTSSQNSAFVSVNSASKDELDSLSGVGPVTAQKIIDNRPYADLNDLVTKKAIGPSLFEKLKNMLSL